VTDAEYPLILTTGRVVSHFLSGEQTRRMFERANARYEASLREGINEREFRPFDEVQVRTKPERGEYTP